MWLLLLALLIFVIALAGGFAVTHFLFVLIIIAILLAILWLLVGRGSRIP